MAATNKELKYDIEKRIVAFHQRLIDDPHHRYRSWEHCFRHFHGDRDPLHHEWIDASALHLAFYLASWGMYRGSSALLWKDYTVHRSVVSLLVRPEYSYLRDSSLVAAGNSETTAKLIISLSGKIREVYRQAITSTDGKPRKFEASDTLVTKILLGTIGCAPACDRYFILGWKHSGLSFTRFNQNFLHRVFHFYTENREAFQKAQQAIIQCSQVEYPAMKLVDMYFWELGFNLLPDEETATSFDPT